MFAASAPFPHKLVLLNVKLCIKLINDPNFSGSQFSLFRVPVPVGIPLRSCAVRIARALGMAQRIRYFPRSVPTQILSPRKKEEFEKPVRFSHTPNPARHKTAVPNLKPAN